MTDNKFYPYFHIDYEAHSSLCGLESILLTTIDCRIYILSDDDKEITIGKAKVIHADIELGDRYGLPPSTVLDLIHETRPYIEAIFNSDEQVNRNTIRKLQKSIKNRNLLIIDRIEILPHYRSQGVTETLIDDVSRLFSARAEILALKAYPLQFERSNPAEAPAAWIEKMSFDLLDADRRNGFISLKCYYTRLGFTSLNHDNVMVRHLEFEDFRNHVFYDY